MKRKLRNTLLIVLLIVLIMIVVYFIGSYTQLNKIVVDYDSKVNLQYCTRDLERYIIIDSSKNVVFVDVTEVRTYYYVDYQDNQIKLQYNGDTIYMQFIDDTKLYNSYDNVMMYLTFKE